MRPSASDLIRGAAIAAAAIVLAGCGGDSTDNASEPGVVLSSAPAGVPAIAVPGDDGTADADGIGDDDRTPDDDSPQGGRPTPDDDVVLRDAPTVADNRAELAVEDQRGDGRSVRVEEVRYSSGSGIVGIYDAGLHLLGWAAVPSGTQPVTIDLERRLGSSQELVAVLHLDGGDGQLDTGDPVVADEGEQVSEDFDYLLG